MYDKRVKKWFLLEGKIMDTLNKIIAEVTAIQNEKKELNEKIREIMSDPDRHYISPICPICHGEGKFDARMYPQAAEETCDMQCNTCHREFNVCVQDKNTGKVYDK